MGHNSQCLCVRPLGFLLAQASNLFDWPPARLRPTIAVAGARATLLCTGVGVVCVNPKGQHERHSIVLCISLCELALFAASHMCCMYTRCGGCPPPGVVSAHWPCGLCPAAACLVARWIAGAPEVGTPAATCYGHLGSLLPCATCLCKEPGRQLREARAQDAASLLVRLLLGRVVALPLFTCCGVVGAKVCCRCVCRARCRERFLSPNVGARGGAGKDQVVAACCNPRWRYRLQPTLSGWRGAGDSNCPSTCQRGFSTCLLWFKTVRKERACAGFACQKMSGAIITTLVMWWQPLLPEICQGAIERTQGEMPLLVPGRP